MCLRYVSSTLVLRTPLLTSNFYRNLIRVLRGLADGSYGGWIPRAEDLYRLQNEAVMYVDRHGFASAPPGHEGPWTRTVDPLGQAITSPVKLRREQQSTEYSGTNGVEPTQLNEHSPMDFLAGSTGFSFGTPVSTLVNDGGLGQPPGLNPNDDPPVPWTEFMTYNDFLMDIGRTARFFEEDFLNSVLFELTPPPFAMNDASPVQSVGSQAPKLVPG